MRYFALLNLQHFVAYLFPAIASVFLIGIAFAFTHFGRKDAEKRQKEIIMTYPDGFEEREGPFPLILILVIVGAVLWAFFYILFVGLLGVKI